jgi:hypothetical protein
MGGRLRQQAGFASARGLALTGLVLVVVGGAREVMPPATVETAVCNFQALMPGGNATCDGGQQAGDRNPLIRVQQSRGWLDTLSEAELRQWTSWLRSVYDRSPRASRAEQLLHECRIGAGFRIVIENADLATSDEATALQRQYVDRLTDLDLPGGRVTRSERAAAGLRGFDGAAGLTRFDPESVCANVGS